MGHDAPVQAARRRLRIEVDLRKRHEVLAGHTQVPHQPAREAIAIDARVRLDVVPQRIVQRIEALSGERSFGAAAERRPCGEQLTAEQVHELVAERDALLGRELREVLGARDHELDRRLAQAELRPGPPVVVPRAQLQ